MKLKQRLHKLYSSLGPAGQLAMEYLYGSVPVRLRKKKGFWSYLEFLRKSQWQPSDWHAEYQQLQLLELLEYAAESSPFYRHLFNSQKVNVSDIRTVGDMVQLPVLSKSALLKHSKTFLPVEFPRRRLITHSTSGSTGRAFKFYLDYYAVMKEEAFAVRHWENAGMKLSESSIYLRSYIPNSGEAFYKYSPSNNRHYLSAYHLEKKNLAFYLQKMSDSQARFIFGYPSSLEIMADLLLDSGAELAFAGAITSSENLSQTARTKIEKAFNTKVYDWYGLAEPTVTMGQCERGSYHLFSEYGMLELLDAQNNPVRTAGQVGRIVGTNFTNRALPLIRYDTGDLGTISTKSCECGRGTPVLVSSIEGRQDDLIIGSNGQYLPSVNFYTLFAHLNGQVKRFQLIQNEKTKFSLKLIRGPEFNEVSEKAIVEGLRTRIGGKPDIAIRTVTKIEPNKAGKLRAVVREYEPAKQNVETLHEN